MIYRLTIKPIVWYGFTDRRVNVFLDVLVKATDSYENGFLGFRLMMGLSLREMFADNNIYFLFLAGFKFMKNVYHLLS